MLDWGVQQGAAALATMKEQSDMYKANIEVIICNADPSRSSADSVNLCAGCQRGRGVVQ